MTTPAPINHPPRRSDPRTQFSRSGHGGQVWKDIYVFFLRTTWPKLIAIFALLFLAINLLFASIYRLIPLSVDGARPGSFADAFFFSVQTFSTIGYGTLSPHGTAGNLLVCLEAFTSLVTSALLTGIVFAKFSRPRARVMFSRVAIVNNRNGVPCFMFRMANERGTDIVQASVRVTLLIDEETQEGEVLRRFYDLKLERESTPVFVLSWTVIHRIDEQSPMFKLDSAFLKEHQVRFFVTMTGIDDTFAQTVNVRHDYVDDDIMFHHRFVDVMTRFPDGHVHMEFEKFHQTIPLLPKEE
jgi:inward rectifier potassium channel